MAESFDIGSVVAKVTADMSGFTQGINQAKEEAASLGDHLTNIADSVRHFAEQAAVVVTAQSIAFGELAKKAIEVASNFEQTETSFGTMLGSEEKAADLMKQIMSFEQKTPFDIQTLTNAAKEMLAFGVNAKQVVPIMSQLTDLSQGQSARLQELVSIYGEVNSIQQLNGREVLRLSSIGIPIYQAIEDHYKKMGDTAMASGEQVKQAISDGTITADVFNQVLTEMTSKGGLFFNENIRQMSTFSGIMSSTQSQFQYAILSIMGVDLNAKNQIVKGGLFDTLRGLAADLLDWLHKLQPVFAEIGKNKDFQYAIEGFVIALASLVVIIPIVIIALNPIILVVVAIEAVIVALFVAWNSNFLGIRDITKNVANEVGNVFNNYLLPLFRAFQAWWSAAWPVISAILTMAWDIISNEVKVAWDLVSGIIKVGIDILTGNWSKAWDDIKTTITSTWNDVLSLLNAALGNISSWGPKVFDALTKPINDAWNTISGIVNKIKDALDFTKRHSPSVLDIVQNGVTLVNQALTGVKFEPNVSAAQIGGNILSAGGMQQGRMNGGISVVVNLPGSIIADNASATRVSEMIGNNIVRRLQQNIRF